MFFFWCLRHKTKSDTRQSQRNSWHSSTDVHQLKSFLALVNFYGKFLPNLSTILAPLYVLLQKHRPWSWGPEQERAFQHAEQGLVTSSLLVHYSERPLLLAADASPYGLGAVLSHTMADGSNWPIAYCMPRGPWPRPNAINCSWTRKPWQLFLQWQGSTTFTWSSFHIVVWPQAAFVFTITRQAYTTYGFITPSEMGITTQRIRLFSSLQARQKSCECRHF